MQSAVLRGALDLVVEERPVPEPAPGEVLVEVTAVGVCGSDVHYYQQGRIGEYVGERPMILGHESAGVIVGSEPESRRHGLASGSRSSRVCPSASPAGTTFARA